MAKPTVPYIRWDERNLAYHHNKRISEDKGCLEELMNINPPPMTVEQYRKRSLDTLASAWAEYEGERWDSEARSRNEARACFVDDDLVMAVTDLERTTFVTCYHAGH